MVCGTMLNIVQRGVPFMDFQGLDVSHGKPGTQDLLFLPGGLCIMYIKSTLPNKLRIIFYYA